ncbi:hypothetical protein CALVIDRAFT_555875 [Calocera viscosa TUFC12733]|uniref:F-box domain-containing protein n=1 Tax=Calocera viscosa (strain TUFC12733) TaxID=1330018 RepID=A0A167KZL2_CALVF|nr:hypothetical protein CALVIDRAFT_555875 [Calocera viscosa TUFC12733]
MPPVPVQEAFASALSLFKAGKLEDALAGFNACIEREPKSHQLFDARSATLERLERHKEALRDAKKVIELSPEQAKGYIRAARLLLRLGKMERSIDACTMAAERLPTFERRRRVEIAALRAQALAAMEARDAALTPLTCHMQKLPYELLSIVFCEWMEEDIVAPVVASHVCRRWRETALSISKLWTTLVLSRHKPELKMATWMKRSHSRCADLRIRNDFELAVDRQEWFTNLIGIVGQSNPVRLDLVGQSNPVCLDLNISQTLRDIIFGSLPTAIIDELRELVLQVSLKNRQGNSAFKLPAFTSLRRLELSNYVRVPSELACRSLEVLVLKSTWTAAEPAAMYRRLISDLPNLRVLSLKSPVPASGIDTSGDFNDVLSLPNLESMELGGPANWLAFVEKMETPSLQSLRLDNCSRTCAAELLATLKLNDSALTELVLSGNGSSEYWLRVVLSRFTNLNKLEIVRSALLTNNLIEDLAEKSLWPRLQYVNFSHTPHITGSPLLRLVRSHLPPPEAAPSDVDKGEAKPIQSEVRPLKSMIIDGCLMVDHALAQKMAILVPDFSCVYMTKEQSVKRRRGDP